MAGGIATARPANDNDGPDILVPIVSGLQELIFGSPGLFVNRPAFIAGPEPETGLAAAVQQVARFNCRTWAARDKSDYSSRVNAGNAELCGPFLDSLGENPEDGSVGLPFTGGQCPEKYVVDYTLDAQNAEASTGTLVTLGPIAGLDEVVQSDGSTRVFLRSSGTVIFSGNCGNNPGFTGPNSTFLGSYTTATGGPSRINGLTPCGADDCGNPAPVVRAPTTVTPTTPLPPNITINLPGLGPVDITLTLNPGGEPVVCIPELDVCVTVEPPTGPGDGEPGGDSDPVNIPGDPTNGPGEPQGGGEGIPGGPDTPNPDGDIDFGAPPVGRAWVGAFVRLDADPEYGNLAEGLAMQRVFPRVVGNAALKHGTARSEAYRLTSEWTGLFRANDNLAVDGCQVTVLPFVSYRVYPVSVETCPENTCSTGDENGA